MSNGQDGETERHQLVSQIRGFSWTHRPIAKGAMYPLKTIETENEILLKHLPNGRIAVFSTYECGSYQPPTPLGFYPQENWCSYEEDKRSYLAEIEEELELPPMELERVVGRLAILFPLPPTPPVPPAPAASLASSDDVPF